MEAKIFPSLISGDLLNLASQLQDLNEVADGYHVDIMDFNFVPNLTWGPAFVNSIKKATTLPLNVHLMVCHPDTYLPLLELAPDDYFCFHVERCPDNSSIDYEYAKNLLAEIKKQNLKSSIAFKPSTPVASLEPLIAHVDDVLLMSVEPGFSGQEFIEASYRRLEELVELKRAHRAHFTISMDGGINEHNIAKLAGMGAEIFGVASAIFDKENPREAIKNLKRLTQF